ncbi:hypothetical protein TNCV_1000851 [Trichonephila clavipes]|nr:hypothetical protein TNCV_1000851 [Trichonephila clavipes]
MTEETTASAPLHICTQKGESLKKILCNSGGRRMGNLYPLPLEGGGDGLVLLPRNENTEEVSLVTAPVQVQSISPLSSSGRVARFLGGSNRGCAGSEIARVGVESTKKPTPDVVVVFET